MLFPPGPVYLFHLVPAFAIPGAGAYLTLRLAGQLLELRSPTWLLIASAVLARPSIFIVSRYVSRLAYHRDAASQGAILAPRVPESTFSIIRKIIKSIKEGYPGEAFDAWGKQLGNVYTFAGITNNGVVTTFEPDHVKAILATQFDTFEKGSIFISQLKSLLGVGIFNVDGDMWKFHRAMTRPFFTRERISDFDIYDRNSNQSLELAKARIAEGYPVEFQDLVSRFTLDSATEFLFGENVGSLSAGIPYPPSATKSNPSSFYDHPSNIFVNAFSEGQVRAALRTGLGDDWPVFEFWGDAVVPFRKIMDNFTTPIMEKALEKREMRIRSNGGDVKEEEEEVSLLAHLVNHTQDPTILKDELINLLVAGRDTTGSLLTFSLYMLSEHPDIEKRLRQEIFDKVGPRGRPNYEQMRELRYVRAFLNEVLRLYPPVPFDSRTTTDKATVWPATSPGSKPIYIPPQTSCLYSVLIMHRRTDLWGPDALTFDPDRFLDERLHKYLTPNPFIFCPFNAGPRICLGQQFAYHEASFYLVRLLQQFTAFKLEAKENIQPPSIWAGCEGIKGIEKVFPAAHLTMYVKGGLWVRMEEYSGVDDV